MPARPLDRAWCEAFAARAAKHLPFAPAHRHETLLSRCIDEAVREEAISVNTARSRWASMRLQFPDLAAPFTGPTVSAPDSAGRSLGEDLALHRAESARKTAERQLAEAKRQIIVLEDKLAQYDALKAHDTQPATFKVKPVRGGGSEHTPYLLTSDHQLGEVIDGAVTESGEGYSVAIYERRMRTLIETTIGICDDHSGGWSYPGIIYGRGGDTISGGIHEELAETDELTPVRAIMKAAEIEGWAIRALAERFGKVWVKDVEGGNHDRDTKKPRSKGAKDHSLDVLVGWHLREIFRADERVEFQTGHGSFDVRFPIYNQTILLTHGDMIGSRGGQGHIGPAATMIRGGLKVRQEQAELGFRVHEVHMGHFHTFLDHAGIVGNGGLPGYSEYAKMFRMRPEPPMQLLMFYHPRFGRVVTRKIIL